MASISVVGSISGSAKEGASVCENLGTKNGCFGESSLTEEIERERKLRLVFKDGTENFCFLDSIDAVVREEQGERLAIVDGRERLCAFLFLECIGKPILSILSEMTDLPSS